MNICSLDRVSRFEGIFRNKLELDLAHKLERVLIFVKLQSKLNSSVEVGQGVDFVFPPSQQQQQE